jgi:hypothetical protein
MHKARYLKRQLIEAGIDGVEEIDSAVPEFPLRLEKVPGRVFSGKKYPSPPSKAVFFCYAIPGRNPRRSIDDSMHAGNSTTLFH